MLVRNAVKAISFTLIRFTHNASAFLLATAVGLVFYQVITRFVFGDSAAWSELLARGLIIWSVFLASAACFHLGAMIQIEAVVRLLPPALQMAMTRVVLVLVLIFLGVLSWYGTLMAIRVVHQQAAMLDISMAWLYAAIPVGSAFAMIAVLARHLDIELDHRTPGGQRAGADEPGTAP
jgi:TRAP-type C4-dicarboxylate transport system permease small subunit